MALPQDVQLAKIYDSLGGGTPSILTGLELLWTYGAPVSHMKEHPMSYGRFAPADIGLTVSISHDTSNEFDFYASLFTNGTDDRWLWFNTVKSGHSFPESEFLVKLIDSPYSDLYGYTIDHIDLTVNNIILSSPGSNPGGGGIWTDFSYDVTYTIYGTPEPATILLLAAGGLILRRKR
jgi:hypothetical protein